MNIQRIKNARGRYVIKDTMDSIHIENTTDVFLEDTLTNEFQCTLRRYLQKGLPIFRNTFDQLGNEPGNPSFGWNRRHNFIVWVSASWCVEHPGQITIHESPKSFLEACSKKYLEYKSKLFIKANRKYHG